eukprot:1762048-Prymnesium_polylepis.1
MRARQLSAEERSFVWHSREAALPADVQELLASILAATPSKPLAQQLQHEPGVAARAANNTYRNLSHLPFSRFRVGHCE